MIKSPFFLKILFALLSLSHGFSFDSFADSSIRAIFTASCDSNVACTPSSGHYASVNGRSVYFNRLPQTFVCSNGKTVEGHALGIIPPNILDDGDNLFDINFVYSNNGNISTLYGTVITTFILNYGQLSQKVLCRAVQGQGSSGAYACRTHVHLSLREIDPDLYRQIEQLKREISDLLNKSQHAKNEIAKYPEKMRVVEEKIRAFTQELSELKGSDFDTIDLKDLGKMIEENPHLKTLYEDVKKGVDVLKAEVEQEIQNNRKEIQKTVAELKQSFKSTNEDLLQYDFDYSKLTQNFAAQHENPSSFQDQIYVQIEEEVLRDLNLTLNHGRKLEFLAGVTSWKKLNDHLANVLDQSLATAAEMQRFAELQHTVNGYISNKIDAYGFFKNAKIPDRIKRILVQEIKAFNPSIAEDLVEKLNQWTEALNPHQQKLLSELESFEELIQKVKQVPGETKGQAQAHELAKTLTQTSLETLARAAELAQESAQEEAFGSYMSEIHQTKDLALSLLDLSLNLTPGVSTGKDIYEALTGTNFVTGEALDKWERAFACIGVLSLGGAHWVKEPLKVLGKIGTKIYKKGLKWIHSSPTDAVQRAGKMVEGARKHGIKIVAGPNATKVDKVIIETLGGKGNVTSKIKLTADEALEAGKKWVGEGYVERQTGKGVFVSRDGMRQFRIDNGSITGVHAPNVPHVHLEEIVPETGKFKANNHIPFGD